MRRGYRQGVVWVGFLVAVGSILTLSKLNDWSNQTVFAFVGLIILAYAAYSIFEGMEYTAEVRHTRPGADSD